MKSVFDVTLVPISEQALRVCVVVGEKQLRSVFRNQPALAVLPMLDFEAGPARYCIDRRDRRAPIVSAPRPRIAKPQRWKNVQRRFVRSPVDRSDLDEDVFDV